MANIGSTTVHAPVTLFVYNRLEHTALTLKSLIENRLAKQSDLFIYSDGPKTVDDQSAVDAVRAYLKTVEGFRSVTIVERKENIGLAKSIIIGVTDIVNRYGKIIVLEDDLVTSPYFLTFMNDALNEYSNVESVMHISGYMFPIDTQDLAESFFIRPTSCWGWGTWSSAWKFFRKDADYYIEIFDEKMKNDFNLDGANSYFNHIVLNKKGELNTWAIFWYASCFIRDGLSLHPKTSFVSNIGMDNSGVHCVNTNAFDVDLSKNKVANFPTDLKPNELANKRLKLFFRHSKRLSIRRVAERCMEFLRELNR